MMIFRKVAGLQDKTFYAMLGIDFIFLPLLKREPGEKK